MTRGNSPQPEDWDRSAFDKQPLVPMRLCRNPTSHFHLVSILGARFHRAQNLSEDITIGILHIFRSITCSLVLFLRNVVGGKYDLEAFSSIFLPRNLVIMISMQKDA